MICLKISTFVVSKTTSYFLQRPTILLWFAWKSVPLWYLKQQHERNITRAAKLWFAWKSVPLWYLKQLLIVFLYNKLVVICLKISTFVVSKTTLFHSCECSSMLWFAWKSVPLWYLKQLASKSICERRCCDLLENQYLCGI